MPNQDNELLQEVDENDKPIGGITRKESRQSGRKYRMVRVLVEDENGNTLIQKRVASKDSYPNCWDNAAAGNVDYGESYEDAAIRELQEEIGVAGASLEEARYYYAEAVSPSGQKLNRFTKIYKTVLPHDTKFTLQESEVSDVKWVTVDDVKKLVEDADNITDGLLQTYQRYYQPS